MANCPCDLAMYVYGGIGLAVVAGTIIQGGYSQAKHPIANYDLAEDIATGLFLALLWPLIVALAPLYGLCKLLAGSGRYFALRHKIKAEREAERAHVRAAKEFERQRILNTPVEDLATQIEARK